MLGERKKSQQGIFYGGAEGIEVRARNSIIKIEGIIGEVFWAGDRLAVRMSDHEVNH